MKQKLLAIIAIFTLTLLPAVSLSASAYAACSDTGSKAQVLNGIGQTGTDCNNSSIDNIVSTIVQILSIVVGAVAIIMIIVSGFRYITSGGDASRVSSAKNTLIYAIIGIAIAVLAQVLVNFVISQSTNAANNCTSNQHFDSSSNKCVKN
jgi:heme/copper-type cytochrome/quinol oxidase subunit 2